MCLNQMNLQQTFPRFVHASRVEFDNKMIFAMVVQEWNIKTLSG